MLSCKSFHNKDGIDAQHSERVIQDIVDLIHLFGLVDYEVLECTVGVQVVHIDRLVDDVVFKGG